MRNQIVCHDALAFMKSMAVESVNLIATSPPYYNARRDSQFETYEAYLEFMKQALSAMWRVLAPGRFLALNSSPIITARTSRNHESERHPIPFDLNTIAQAVGFQFLEDIVWMKPAGAAVMRNGGFMQTRKPLAYKPNTITEYIFIYRKPSGHLIDWHLQKIADGTMAVSLVPDGFETTNVWQIQPETQSGHPAAMPLKLAERLVRYYSFMGELVFDPFCGSGTTPLAAWRLGRDYLACDREAKYMVMAQERLQSADPLQPTPVGDNQVQLPLWSIRDDK